MKCLLIVNPTSGRKNIQATLHELVGKLVLKKVITSFEVFYTQGHRDAYQLLLTLAPHQYDLIISVGGDGTQSEVINGIIDGKCDIPLYILAAGTVNDLSRALKIPEKHDDVVKTIAKFHQIKMDVGKANHVYFANVLAGGMFTDIGFKVDKKKKAILGPFAYYLNAILDLPNQLNSTMDLHIEIGGEVMDEEAYMFLVTNSRLVGGFLLASQADLCDGLLDLLVVKKCEITDLIALSKDILLNKHLESPFIIYRQAKHIQLSSSKSITLDIDGEQANELPIDISVAPQAIKIITPKTRKTKK